MLSLGVASLLHLLTSAMPVLYQRRDDLAQVLHYIDELRCHVLSPLVPIPGQTALSKNSGSEWDGQLFSYSIVYSWFGTLNCAVNAPASAISVGISQLGQHAGPIGKYTIDMR
jgi:hypothetical protein